MCFEQLYESMKRKELILIEGGFCHYHLRRNGQLTIREILSTRPGAGKEILEKLKQVQGATSLFAKCPVDLVSNGFYAHMGFVCEGEESTPSGRKLNCWRLVLHENA